MVLDPWFGANIPSLKAIIYKWHKWYQSSRSWFRWNWTPHQKYHLITCNIFTFFCPDYYCSEVCFFRFVLECSGFYFKGFKSRIILFTLIQITLLLLYPPVYLTGKGIFLKRDILICSHLLPDSSRLSGRDRNREVA